MVFVRLIARKGKLNAVVNASILTPTVYTVELEAFALARVVVENVPVVRFAAVVSAY